MTRRRVRDIYLTFLSRGWQDGPDSHDHGFRVLHLRLLCPDLRVHPIVGYGRCAGHRRLSHDPQVSASSERVLGWY